MADNLQNIRILIEADAKDAETKVQRVAVALKKMADEAGVSSKKMADSIKRAYEDINMLSKNPMKTSTAEFDKMIGAAQKLVSAEERVAQAKQKRLDRRFEQQQERETQNIEKQARALAELESRLRSGTASAREFANALMGGAGAGALKGKMSPTTVSAMQNIPAGKVSGGIVSQVTEAMKEVQKITGQSTENVRSMMRSMFGNIDVENLNRATKRLQGLPLLADKIKTAFQQVWNTIKGTLTAMLVFYATQPIIDFFTGAIAAAKKFRGEMVQLNFAEAVLSEKGIEISKKNLDDLVDYIEEKYRYLSKLEAISIVSEVSDVSAEYGLNTDQMKSLMDTMAFVNMKEKMLGKDATEAGSFLNALIDMRSNFFNALGLNISEVLVKEKAYEMGLANVGEELSKQVRIEAALALAYEQSADKLDELNDALDDTAVGREMLVAKKMADEQIRVGEAMAGVTDAWNTLILAMADDGALTDATDSIIGLIDNVSELVRVLEIARSAWMDTTDVLNSGVEDKDTFWDWLILDWGGVLLNPLKQMTLLIKAAWTGVLLFGAALAEIATDLAVFFGTLARGDGVQQAFENVGKVWGKATIQGFKNALSVFAKEDSWLGEGVRSFAKQMGWGDLTDFSLAPKPAVKGLVDTPTGVKKSDTPAIDEAKQKELEALEKWNDEILDEQLKFTQDMEELEIDMARKLEDIATEYARKRADAYKDYQDDILGINNDYRDKVADIQLKMAEEAQETRDDELEKEREYQNKLLELKEKFLMDLEDALHERDARAVLRLIKQYNLDKAQAEREKALDKEKDVADAKQAQAKFQAEMQQAQAERNQKLADAKLHYEQELRDINEAEKRERDDLELWYRRQLEDLDRAMKDRLEVTFGNLLQEYEITKEMLDKMYALYAGYYGDIANLQAVQSTMGSMYQQQMAMNAMTGGQAYFQTPTTNGFSAPAPTHHPYATNQFKPQGSWGTMPTTDPYWAEGGTMITDKPTRAIFGEAGLEMATFTPLNRQGRDVNKIFSNMSPSAGGAGGNGRVSIELLLSPDLEGRVVANALNATAEVIMRTQRSR